MKYVQILSTEQSNVAGQWSSCNSYCTSVPQTLVFEPKVAKKKYLIEIHIWITLIASPLMISVLYCTIIWPNRLGYIYFQNLTNCSFQVTLLIMWIDYFESNQIFKQDYWFQNICRISCPKTEISSQLTAVKEEPKAQISGKECFVLFILLDGQLHLKIGSMKSKIASW